MSQISQKQAVVDAVTDILGDSFTLGSTNIKDAISSEQKTKVREVVFAGIKAGTVIKKKEFTSDGELRRYVNSMIDNHFRKSSDLNGGNKYSPENTGQRRDPQLRELNKLLKKYPEGTTEFGQITDHIATRNGQLDQLRSQKRTDAAIGTINKEALPEALQALVDQPKTKV